MTEDNENDQVRRTDDEFPDPSTEPPLGFTQGPRQSLDIPGSQDIDAFAIGGRDDRDDDEDDDCVDLDACECSWPELTVERTEVGPAVVQVLYCNRCSHLFETVSVRGEIDE